MIDEKIQEPQDELSPAPPPLTIKGRMRAAWAHVQCSSLLRRHRFQRRTRRHMDSLGALVCTLPLVGQVGDWLYLPPPSPAFRANTP